MSPTDQTPAAYTQRICTQPASDRRIQAEDAIGPTSQLPPDDAEAMLDRIRMQRPTKVKLWECVVLSFWSTSIAFGLAGFMLGIFVMRPFNDLTSGLVICLTSGLVGGMLGGILGGMGGFFLWLINLPMDQ